MARTYSNSIVVGNIPQHADVLVILSGGIAFIVTQLGNQLVPWLFYALLAALFAAIWPNKALYWGGWLCLPIILLVCFDLVMTRSINGLFRNGTILPKALPSACPERGIKRATLSVSDEAESVTRVHKTWP